jgi:hypothetical protein
MSIEKTNDYENVLQGNNLIDKNIQLESSFIPLNNNYEKIRFLLVLLNVKNN